MFRMIIAAAAVVLASAASANTANVYLEGGGAKAHVSYSDLDLRSQAGRSMLVGRIRLAANLLCTEGSDALPFSPSRGVCLRNAVNSGLTQMNAIAGMAG